MGVLEELETRVNERTDRKFDVITRDMADVKTRLGGVETRLGGVETRLDGVETRLDGVETRLGRVEVRLDGLASDMNEVKAGQIEIRNMVATLLTRSEQRKGS
jgi:archaellum component FlaC